jgi:hypothetical protein
MAAFVEQMWDAVRELADGNVRRVGGGLATDDEGEREEVGGLGVTGATAAMARMNMQSSPCATGVGGLGFVSPYFLAGGGLPNATPQNLPVVTPAGEIFEDSFTRPYVAPTGPRGDAGDEDDTADDDDFPVRVGDEPRRDEPSTTESETPQQQPRASDSDRFVNPLETDPSSGEYKISFDSIDSVYTIFLDFVKANNDIFAKAAAGGAVAFAALAADYLRAREARSIGAPARWRKQQGELKDALTKETEALETWQTRTDSMIEGATQSRDGRACVSTALAQTVLIQLLGESEAPRLILRGVEQDTRNGVAARFQAACTASLEALIVWMTLGELSDIASEVCK